MNFGERLRTMGIELYPDDDCLDIFAENSHEEPLNEMAKTCRLEDGFGIEVEVQSDDHKLPHAHVYDSNKKPIGRFLLFTKTPASAQDIRSYPGDDVSSVKHELFKWATASNKSFQVCGATGTNWFATLIQWATFHPESPIPQ